MVTPEAKWPPSWRRAHYYDRLEVYDLAEDHELGHAYAYRERMKRTVDMVRRSAPPGARILDVAAAQGNFTLTLAELGYEVTWNDLRRELAEYVQLKHEHGEVNYLPGEIFTLDASEPFDVVLATEIVEHVAHPDEFIRHLARFVRPDGYLVMTTPNGAYLRNRLPSFSRCADPTEFERMQFKPDADGHIFLFDTGELSALAGNAGLQVAEVCVFANPLTTGWVGTRHALKGLPRAWVTSLERASGRLPLAVKQRLMTHVGARFRRAGPGPNPAS